MTTRSGSVAYANRPTSSLEEARKQLAGDPVDHRAAVRVGDRGDLGQPGDAPREHHRRGDGADDDADGEVLPGAPGTPVSPFT